MSLGRYLTRLRVMPCLLLLATLMFVAGCATTQSVQELEERLVAENERLRNELRREIAANAQANREAREQITALRGDQQTQGTELTGRIDEARRAIESDVASRDAAQTRQREALESQLQSRMSELRENVAETRSQLRDQMDRLDARLVAEISDTREDINRRIDHETGLLQGEVGLVRAESRDAHNQARRVSAAMHSALHRQREVAREQFQTLDGLAQTLDEILDTEGTGSQPENATTLFQLALDAHRDATERDDVDKYLEALELYKRGLILMPDHVPAQYNAASILLELDRPQDAVPHLEQVIVLAPEGTHAPRARRILREIRR